MCAKISCLGIITSGGDCGGLNAVIKGAAFAARNKGIKIYIIPNGYAGLYNLIDMDRLVELDEKMTDSIDVCLAGSEAGHSRVKIAKIPDKDKYNRIKQGLKKFGIDGLIISGGDDSGSVMVDLEEHGIPCVHAPKTMDLDLQTYSVGADSTMNRIANFVEDLRTTGKTHNRIIIVEVFGRYAGHTALRGGIAANADAILIPEIPVDFDILYKHMKKTYMKRIEESPLKSGSYIIVVAEGLKDATGRELVDESAGSDSFGHKKLAGAGKYVRQELTKRMKADSEIEEFMKNNYLFVKEIYEIPEAREIRPGHLVRCGRTSVYDVAFGLEAGYSAVELIAEGISGVSVVGIDGEKILYKPTVDVIKQRLVDLKTVALYESMGVCFGRVPVRFIPKFEEIQGKIRRFL